MPNPLKLAALLLGALFLCAAIASPQLSEQQASATGLVLVGDANCDGTVNPVDATFILQFSADLISALPCPKNGDTNGDGATSPVDASLVLQLGAGIIDALAPVPTSTNTPTQTHTPPPPTSTPTHTPAPPTATQTIIPAMPSATATLPPCDVLFASSPADQDTFCGVFSSADAVKLIPGSPDSVDAPAGTQYTILFMDVTNFGSDAAVVTTFGFRVVDGDGNSYTLSGWDASTAASLAAEAFYSRPGPFTELQPSTTVSMVFAFWTPQVVAALFLERCPLAGCGENALQAAPTPTPATTPPPIDLTRCAEELFDWAQSLYRSSLTKLNVQTHCGSHPDVYTEDSPSPVDSDICADALYDWAVSGFTSATAETDVGVWC